MQEQWDVNHVFCSIGISPEAKGALFGDLVFSTPAKSYAHCLAKLTCDI